MQHSNPQGLRSTSPGRALLTRIVALALGVAIAWGLLEVIAYARWVDYRLVFQTLSDEPWRHPGNRLDPDLLHVHQPNQHMQYVMNGGDIASYLALDTKRTYHIDVVTDRHGFRNSKDIDQADIVVVGDSFVEGINVREEETLSARLGEALQASSVNLGQIWYSPQQEWETLRRFGIPLKPSVVVWCFFEGNDLRDTLRYKSSHENWDDISGGFHTFAQRSFTRNAIKRVLSAFQHSRGLPTGENNHGMTAGGEKMYFFYRADEPTLAERESLVSLEGVLQDAYGLCQAAGARMVFAYIPVKFRVYASSCQFPESSVCRDWKLSDLPKEVRRIVGRVSEEIRFVDLAPALEERVRAGVETYFPDDTHWNEEGHRVAAEAISQVITRSEDEKHETQPK